MSANYDGLTRNTWTGTWSPSGDHPIVLDTEIRGSLQSITGFAGDRLTDITGQRLTEGMLVYVKNTYTVSVELTRQGNMYYQYTLLNGQSRNPNTGIMPNAEANWSIFTMTLDKLESILNVGIQNGVIPNNSVLQYNDTTKTWNVTTEVSGLTLDSGSF